jgi:hypothetical protein
MPLLRHCYLLVSFGEGRGASMGLADVINRS